jgi:hypothetical protein
MPVTPAHSHWPRSLSLYVVIHGAWLGLYALLGKGFAYAGWPPFYAGEILLLVGIPALLATRRIVALCKTSLGIGLICFTAWQIACAVPYFEVYGIDTLRDSAIWGYSVFAWITAALVLRLPGFLSWVVLGYRRFAKVFLIIGPVAWLATLYLREWLPRWPETTVTLPLIKGDEFCVHLAGILAFLMQRLAPVSHGWLFLVLADAATAMGVRSGLVAFLIAAGCVIFLRPRARGLASVAAAALILMVTMATFDFHFVMPGTQREFSLDQLSDSVRSVVGVSQRSDLESTKNWRLIWWREIKDYTLDGPYFWAGKGYGINLADSDGFQVGTRDEPLRSPHSSHLNFLARSGVPGFALWLLLQVIWVSQMLAAYLRANRLHLEGWQGLFAWIIAYWVAFVTAAGFDVFLEGPMAGIPFWTLLGLGWGSQTRFTSQAQQIFTAQRKRSGTQTPELSYARSHS